MSGGAAAAGDVAAAVDALRGSFPPARLIVDPERREAYGRDESDLGARPPDVVVLVERAEEVQAVFAVAARHRVPVIPVGARSGKSGGIMAVEGGIAVSLERMSRILEISAGDGLCRVEPGVITGQLQAEVERQGLFYPPDPNSLDSCTLGGNVAENAGGPRALKYGVTREYVLGLTVVLPTGEILRTGRRTIKGVAGYDLTGLFVGSEGTLGIVTEITLKLLPRPRHVSTALVCFRDLTSAARAVRRWPPTGRRRAIRRGRAWANRPPAWATENRTKAPPASAPKPSASTPRAVSMPTRSTRAPMGGPATTMEFPVG